MKVTNQHGIVVDCTDIADLWHIACTQKSSNAREAILEVWRQAHSMRDELARLQANTTERNS